MSNAPVLRDWRQQVEDKLKVLRNEQQDIVDTILLCDECMAEIEPARSWIDEQCGYVGQLKNSKVVELRTRFHVEPPSYERKTTLVNAAGTTRTVQTSEGVLDTKIRKRNAIREIAARLAPNIGDVVDVETVKAELKRQGKTLVGKNPNAVIGTVLNGLVAFGKIEGKRGFFKKVK